MSPFFGKKRSEGKTILLLDVENGSVGGVFARLSPNQAPKLFGEVRKKIRVLPSRNAQTLAVEVEKAMQEVLMHASMVAARIRLSGRLSSIGEVTRGAVFLRAPWVHVDFDEAGAPTTNAVEEFLDTTRRQYRVAMGESPLSLHSFGVSTGPILHTLFTPPGQSLICALGSEITELFVTDGQSVRGYATLPVGVNTIIRTLKTHNGLSEAEIYSALRLSHSRNAEALHASALHILREFASATHRLFHMESSQHVFVVAEEPFAEWFARALGEGGLYEIFSEGGEVRALSRQHLAPYIAAHAHKPDIPLMLVSLFADARWGTV